MSTHTHRIMDIENMRADFDSFVSQRNWSDANALLDNLWDLGYKPEAIILGRALVAAKMRVESHPEDDFGGNWKTDGDIKETMLRSEDEEIW